MFCSRQRAGNAPRPKKCTENASTQQCSRDNPVLHHLPGRSTPPPRPHSPAPRLQLSGKLGLLTWVRTAHAAETCHAHLNVYLKRRIITPPCIPPPPASPASCSSPISVTAKSARPEGSARRHHPTTNPAKGSRLQETSLGFYQASPQRKRPLPLPASDFPPAPWVRNVGLRLKIRPHGSRCGAAVPG